ncbi:NUDIX hydrolase [Paraburkholderia youngii]|uniref:NUDIX hydrolase n=1 Tax=Paraburkholderia youngii TaxID=2782701 RepID=UPI003D20B48F
MDLFYKVEEGEEPIELHRNRFTRSMYDGRYHYVEYLSHLSGVIVIPQWPNGDYELVRAQRVPSLGFSYEFPRGLTERDETPQEAALRELTEETGLRGERHTLRYLGRVFGDTAMINSWCDVFSVRVVAEMPARRVVAHEPGSPVRMGAEFFAQAIKTNLIRCGFTLSAAMLAHAAEQPEPQPPS